MATKTFKRVDSINTYKSVDVMSIPYGICSTEASTAQKEVNISNFVLEEGIAIRVKFANSNSASDPTLLVNYQDIENLAWQGTKAIAITGSTSWKSGEVVTFVYDGTNWISTYAQLNGGTTSYTLYMNEITSSVATGATFYVHTVFNSRNYLSGFSELYDYILTLRNMSLPVNGWVVTPEGQYPLTALAIDMTDMGERQISFYYAAGAEFNTIVKYTLDDILQNSRFTFSSRLIY